METASVDNQKLVAQTAKTVYKIVLDKFLAICADELSQEKIDEILEAFSTRNRLSWLILKETMEKNSEVMVYFDDIRNPHESVSMFGNLYAKEWHVVRSIPDLKAIVEVKMPDLISFDHDMTFKNYGGDYSDKQTGFDALQWLLDYCDARNVRPPIIKLHTMSDQGRERMQSLLNVWETAHRIV